MTTLCYHETNRGFRVGAQEAKARCSRQAASPSSYCHNDEHRTNGLGLLVSPKGIAWWAIPTGQGGYAATSILSLSVHLKARDLNFQTKNPG